MEKNDDFTVFMQRFNSFMDYFAQFTEKKRDQLQYSNATVPNRVIPIRGLDLSEDLNGLFREYQIPVRSMHIEKIYSATTGLAVEGEVKMSFDYNNINGIRNYKLLQANDSFIFDQTISKFALGWDVQSDVLVDIACMIDIDYKAGSTKTSITGAVSAIITTPPVPSSVISFDLADSGPYELTTGTVAVVTVCLQAGISFFIDGNLALKNAYATIPSIQPSANLWVAPGSGGGNPAPTVPGTSTVNEGVLLASASMGSGVSTSTQTMPPATTALKPVFQTTNSLIAYTITQKFTLSGGTTISTDGGTDECSVTIEYYTI